MKAFLARALVCAFPCVAMAQIAGLQIKVLEGEGAVYQAGAHITHPLTVEVTDENGRPVTGAVVSFQLPPDGPGGLFSNGLRTDLVVTDARGRAALHALQLNRTGGQFRIRITAVKEQARAGIVSVAYIGGDSVAGPAAAKPATPGITANSAPGPSAPAPAIKSGEITRNTTKMESGGHKKWIVLAAVAAGGAVAFLGISRKSKSSSTSTVSSSTVSIGSPVITVGQP